MNDRLLDLLIEFDEMGFAPTTLCEDPEEYAKKWRDRVLEAVKALEDENTTMRERLEKAVEFKAMAGDTIYMPWVWGGTRGIAILEVLFIEMCANELEYNTDFETDDIAYSAFYKFGKFRANDFGRIVFTTREAAEARLEELKGEKS